MDYRLENLKTLKPTAKFKKIRGIGNPQLIPADATIQEFFDVVNETLADEENPLIGVVCTNGTNRGGYMICRYLIEILEWTPDEAIQTFNEARGHDITREQNLRSFTPL